MKPRANPKGDWSMGHSLWKFNRSDHMHDPTSDSPRRKAHKPLYVQFRGHSKVRMSYQQPLEPVAADAAEETILLDAAPCTNVRSVERGQKCDKINQSFAKGL